MQVQGHSYRDLQGQGRDFIVAKILKDFQLNLKPKAQRKHS